MKLIEGHDTVESGSFLGQRFVKLPCIMIIKIVLAPTHTTISG